MNRFIGILLACGIAGCFPPPPDLSAQWYTGQNPDTLSSAGLKGKVIVLDPGHGGTYDGAVGKNGLKEKDINLKIALRLSQLLDSAGACPILTRSRDQDFLPDTGTVKNAKMDLTERMTRANLTRADLFVSLHHNASEDRDRNEALTFYAMRDAGPSLEAGQTLQSAFASWLRIEPQALKPGNYFVLRQARAAAVLGEPSYLSNERQEEILRSDGAVETEARAYFTGIARYFSGGIPKIVEIQPSGKTFSCATPLIWADIEPGATGLSETGILCWLDSLQVPAFYSGDSEIVARPAKPLSNGPHTVCLSLQNSADRSSVLACSRFATSLSPAHLSLTASPDKISRKNPGWNCLRAFVADSLGQPVADSLPVIFRSVRGEWLRDTAYTENGAALSYFRPDRPESVRVWASAGEWTDSLWLIPVPQARLSGFAVDSLSGLPVAGAQILSAGRIPLGETDASGFYNVEGEQAPIQFRKNGYWPVVCSLSFAKPCLLPMDGGAIAGLRVMIDPEFGGDESGYVGRSGQRAADWNRRFAEKVGDRLERAGAQVTFTRTGNDAQTPFQRVALSIGQNPGLFVSIGYDSLGGEGIKTYYYLASEAGKTIARHVGDAVRVMAGKNSFRGVSGTSNFVLQQTSCPAIRVSPGGMDAPEPSEAELSAETYSVLRGIVNAWQTVPQKKVTVYPLPDSLAELPQVRTTLDDCLEFCPNPEGKIVFHGIPEGPHVLAVFTGNHFVARLFFRTDAQGRLK